MSSYKNTPVSSADQKPHFFKIILEDTLSEGKLLIPVKFVRKYLNDVPVPTKVILEVPRCKKWEVELSKSDGKTCLQNGWKEFAEHYSVKYGCLVVFRYEELCKFHVLVFDMSCTETEYPKQHTKDEDDDLSIEISDMPSSCGRKRGRSSSSYSWPYKTSKTRLTQVVGMNSKSEPKTSGVERGIAIAGQRKWKQARPPSPEAHQACENSSFSKTIKPSFKAFMRVPVEFTDKHILGPQRRTDVILEVEDRSWKVELLTMATSKRYGCFSGGWPKFTRDNLLKVGDVCVFKLIKACDVVRMKVSIKRC